MIKRLPLYRIEELLTIANQSFKTEYVPNSWKVGMIIPILKPGKDKRDISSYQPILLLPCLGKIVEGFIQKRLQFIVDTKKLLERSQMGQGTMNLHVQLEHSIRSALDSKKTCLVVFIDLSTAFDKIWHA